MFPAFLKFITKKVGGDMAFLALDLAARFLPKIPEVTFHGIDLLQYRRTQMGNLFKVLVGQHISHGVLSLWSKMTHRPINQWNEKTILPSLPLPPLEQSLAQLKIVAKRILSEEDLSAFHQECESFASQAWLLQICLWGISLVNDCWANKLWQLGAYDCNDSPLRESSHWLGFDRKDMVKDYSSFSHPECVRSVILLKALVKYREDLLNGTCLDDLVFRFKKAKIDASTCLNIFSARIPGEALDSYRSNINSTHVIIESCGYFYKLDLFEQGHLKSQERLYQELVLIKNDSEKLKTPQDNVCILTTGHRRDWFKQRQLLLQEEINKVTFKEIESALLMIHFDPQEVWHNNAEAAEFVYQQRERVWDDITLGVHLKKGDASLICVCGHGNVDATGAAPALESFFAQEQGLKENFKPCSENSHSSVSFLPFSVNESVKSVIEALQHKPINNDLHVRELEYTHFTKEKCKKAQLNPDSVVHQAFQLAWARTFPSLNGVETYGAISMRAYQNARTEQSHPYTEQSQAFVDKILKNEQENDTVSALTEAVEALSLQKTNIIRSNHQGHDRHLFGLYILSKYFNKEIPLLERYISQIFHYKLSTSQLPQEMGTGGCFLPTEKDGIGIFYPIADPDAMRFVVTTYLDKDVADAFVNNLEQSLNDINNLLEKIIQDKGEFGS